METTKWLYWGLRVLAVNVLVIGMCILGIGAIDIWQLFTDGGWPYSISDKLLYGVTVAGGMTVVGLASVAITLVLWNMKKLLAGL